MVVIIIGCLEVTPGSVSASQKQQKFPFGLCPVLKNKGGILILFFFCKTSSKLSYLVTYWSYSKFGHTVEKLMEFLSLVFVTVQGSNFVYINKGVTPT